MPEISLSKTSVLYTLSFNLELLVKEGIHSVNALGNSRCLVLAWKTGEWGFPLVSPVRATSERL